VCDDLIPPWVRTVIPDVVAPSEQSSDGEVFETVVYGDRWTTASKTFQLVEIDTVVAASMVPHRHGYVVLLDEATLTPAAVWTQTRLEEVQVCESCNSLRVGNVFIDGSEKTLEAIKTDSEVTMKGNLGWKAKDFVRELLVAYRDKGKAAFLYSPLNELLASSQRYWIKSLPSACLVPNSWQVNSMSVLPERPTQVVVFEPLWGDIVDASVMMFTSKAWEALIDAVVFDDSGASIPITFWVYGDHMDMDLIAGVRMEMTDDVRVSIWPRCVWWRAGDNDSH